MPSCDGLKTTRDSCCTLDIRAILIPILNSGTCGISINTAAYYSGVLNSPLAFFTGEKRKPATDCSRMHECFGYLCAARFSRSATNGRA